MTIRGLNHLTLSISDLGRSIAFYCDGLGMTLDAEWPEGAYLSAGDLWICLTLDPATRTGPLDEYTHSAFSVSPEDFAATVARVTNAGAKPWRDNKSEGESHYFLDPDGHKLELHVGDLDHRLEHYRRSGRDNMTIYRKS